MAFELHYCAQEILDEFTLDASMSSNLQDMLPIRVSL